MTTCYEYLYRSVPQIRQSHFKSPNPKEDSSRSRNIKPLGCSPRKCLPRTRTVGINDGHASLVLRRSALLPRPSTVKLVSLPLVSGASLRLAFSPTLHRQWGHAFFYRNGGRNRERSCRIPRISPPLRFVLRLRLRKGEGVFAGHYSTLCLYYTISQ